MSRTFRALPPLDELLKRFVYDSATGVITYRTDHRFGRNGRRVIKAGTVAGTVHRDGYRSIRIDGVSYLAHRVAFKLIYGEEPLNQVDHKDRNRANNVCENLRIATPRQNNENRRISDHNKTGCIGVSRWALTEKWRAQITVNRKQIHLGTFDSFDDAVVARQKAAAELFGDFSPHREAA
jgi:hypothetical protein